MDYMLVRLYRADKDLNYVLKTTTCDKKKFTDSSPSELYELIQSIVRDSGHCITGGSWSHNAHIYSYPDVRRITSGSSTFECENEIERHQRLMLKTETTQNGTDILSLIYENAQVRLTRGRSCQQWHLWDETLMQGRADSYPDFELVVSGKQILIHRCIIYTQSNWFVNLFSMDDGTNKAQMQLPTSVTVEVFQFMLSYFYGRHFLGDNMKTPYFMAQCLVCADYFMADSFLNATIEQIIHNGHKDAKDLLQHFRRFSTKFQWKKLLGAFPVDIGKYIDDDNGTRGERRRSRSRSPRRASR